MMNLAAELEVSAPAGAETRRSARMSLNVPGGLRQQNSLTLTATILDLSTHGFRATLSSPVQEGAVVWVRLPGLAAQQARVAWAEGLTVGCALTAPLHPAVFDHIVKTHGRG